MQLGGFEVKGWSDAEVDSIILTTENILTTLEEPDPNSAVLNLFLMAIGVFVVAIFAYIVSGDFLPTASELTGDN